MRSGWRVNSPLTISFFTSLLLVAATPAFAAEQSTPTIVFLGPASPVFIKTQIQVDRKPFDQWLTTFLFAALDTNRDKSLSAAEVKEVPLPLLSANSSDNAESIFKRMDQDPADEKISAAEFKAAMRPDQGDLFSIIADSQSQASVVQLLPLIDADNNGQLTREELARGTQTLYRRDLDDDETFSAAELLPFSDPLNRTAVVVARTADLPFVSNSSQTMELLIKRIESRYGKNGTQKLNAQALRIPDSAFQSFDKDGDGTFNQQELTDFLKNPPAHVSVTISIPGKGYVRPTATIEVSDSAQDWISTGEKMVGRRKYPQLTIDGIPIDVRPAGGALTRRNDSKRFIGQRFSLADTDKNSYLDKSEYMSLAGMTRLPVNFESADTNGDEMVFREELYTSIDRNSMIGQSRVVMKVRREGGSLFEMLDDNKDNRLSRREFQSGFAKVTDQDKNSDGQIAETELTSQFTLRFELSQPAGIPAGTPANMNQMADARVPAISRLVGPRWFVRMDRNRDGDVSLREFPGTETMFKKVDTDNDGLITAEEASAVSSSNKQSAVEQ